MPKIAVEPISASEGFADVELKVTYAPIRSPGMMVEDVIRFTILDVAPIVPGEIDADAGELFAYIPLPGDGTSFSGENARLTLYQGDTALAVEDVVVTDGAITAVFNVPRIAGQEYSVESSFRGLRKRSETVRVIAGAPDAIELIASKLSYVADGTDEITLTATIRDQFGNLVEDGTTVTWNLGFGGGTFVDGTATAATETTDGVATITLRAPDVPGIQHVVVTAGAAESFLDIAAEAADFQMTGVASLDIDTGQSGAVVVFNANVADGTPVFWTLSSGEIAGGEDGGRVFEGTVQNGTASIDIAATGAWARVGRAVVTATIAGRLHYHEVEFETSGPFAVEIEQWVLAGDKTANGVKTIVYEDSNPTWEGQPAWGFGPPPQNWPAPNNVDYYAATQVTIRGTAFETYYLISDSAFNAFAQFERLGSNNEIQLDGSGVGTFTIRSKGLLAPNQFLPFEFTVREGNPFVGAPETVERGMLVDHDWSTRTKQFAKGLFGADTEGVSGASGGFFGSLILVADIGSLIKNGWRAAGGSDQPVNKLEVLFGALGVATTAATVAGDSPAAIIRSLAASTDAAQLGKILANLLARGLASGADLTKLGALAARLMRNDIAFQGARQILTSEDLVGAAVRIVDKFGEASETVLERLAFTSRTFSIRAAQEVANLFGRLSDDVLDVFKNLDHSQIDDVVEHLGAIFQAGKVDIAQIQKLLDNSALYTAAYDRVKLLQDLRVLNDSERLGTLVNYLKSQTLPGPVQGRLYELQTAARIIDNNPGSKVTWVSKYAKEVDPITGKRLASTDVDFIVDDGTNLIYYQAKSSATAFGDDIDEAIREARRWIDIVQKDAERNGITNQVIRYVTPDKNLVAVHGGLGSRDGDGWPLR